MVPVGPQYKLFWTVPLVLFAEPTILAACIKELIARDWQSCSVSRSVISEIWKVKSASAVQQLTALHTEKFSCLSLVKCVFVSVPKMTHV